MIEGDVMIENWKASWGKRIRDSLYPISAGLAILILWQWATVFFSIRDTLLPSPLVVFREFFNLRSLLYTHALVTIYETFFGLILAIFISIIISIIMVWSVGAEKAILPWIVFFESTPKIAIGPLLIIWFGFGYAPKVIVSFWLAYFPITIATMTGLKAIPPEMVELTKSMSATTLQTFIKVRIPNALPYFFSGLKLGGVVSMLGAVLGEYIGSDAGLGYLIVMANFNANVKLLFPVVITMVILGKTMYSLVVWVEKYAISWHVAVRSKEEKFFTA